jgi:hypothetical protein
MPTHLDYVALRLRHEELARRAERVRQQRDGLAPAPARSERRVLFTLFARLRPRRPAQAPAGPR